ncbi:MAG: transcriptional repressor LexA [Geminicoccaceae bacterium]|nr:MAG: transcriptional repressor LexA [Geminicoccaceae bacterium]
MLTPRQHQLLHFIHDYVTRHGVSPSFEEMRDSLELRSKSGIHRLITGLEERGYIRRLAHRARAIELLRAPPVASDGPAGGNLRAADNIVTGHFGAPPAARETASRSLPFFGRIAAGTPIEAICDHNSTTDVPEHLVGEGEHYTLQVVGDSMIEAGIHDGDLVIVKRCDQADNNAIVVALIEEREATLKRLHRRGAAIALEAANPAYETRIFRPDQVRIQGRLVGLIRRYG